MTNNNFKNQFAAKNTKQIVAYAGLFVLPFAMFQIPLVDATCGTATKYNAGGFLTETGDRWGNEAIIKINAVSICGTDPTSSYAHITNGGHTSGTSDGSDFIEAGIYKGNQAGFSTGSDLHYNMIVQNFYNGGKIFTDITAGTGQKPLVGDNVKFTLNWDHNANFKDYYKLVITNGVNTLTINDIWVDGRGTDMTTQSEKLSQSSAIKGTSTSIRDYSTGLAWSDWTSSTGNVIPSTTDNTMCFVKNSEKSYSFGEKSGSTCLTS
jgi:hypothetical protein